MTDSSPEISSSDDHSPNITETQADMSTSPESPSRAQTRADTHRWVENSKREVESICHQIIRGINDGHFNPKDPIWRVTMEGFQAAAAFAEFPAFCDLERLLWSYQIHKWNNPCYEIELNDRIQTKIDERKQAAKCYVNILSRGIPNGQTRQSVAQLDFKYCLRKKRWLCEKYRCMPGMGPSLYY